jgi:hypothetical protein
LRFQNPAFSFIGLLYGSDSAATGHERAYKDGSKFSG